MGITQQQQVVEFFIINDNQSIHYKKLANQLNILVPNMRRILGQGEKNNIFIRVSPGKYKFNNK